MTALISASFKFQIWPAGVLGIDESLLAECGLDGGGALADCCCGGGDV